MGFVKLFSDIKVSLGLSGKKTLVKAKERKLVVINPSPKLPAVKKRLITRTYQTNQKRRCIYIAAARKCILVTLCVFAPMYVGIYTLADSHYLFLICLFCRDLFNLISKCPLVMVICSQSYCLTNQTQ